MTFDDGIAKELGFENAQEMQELIAAVDLSSLDALSRFQEWKNSDGTRDGLVRRFPYLVQNGEI